MADSMWSQVSSRCLLAPSRIGCANNVIHSPTASSVQPMETIHCSTFCNIGMRLPAPILLLVRGRDFLYTVRRVKEDQQKNGQRPWESWPEAVRVLARGRARGISPGPVNVALLALELVSPSHSLPVDSLSRSSEDGSREPMLKSTGVGMKPMT